MAGLERIDTNQSQLFLSIISSLSYLLVVPAGNIMLKDAAWSISIVAKVTRQSVPLCG